MNQRITAIVNEALTDLFEEQGIEREVNAETVIYSSDDGVDSLSLVRLVTQVEMDVNDEFSKDIVLASEKAMSMKNSPYRNVGAFVEFIIGEMTE